MGDKREATNLAEFARFRAVGAAVLGYVERMGENGNGPFAILSPAGFRASKDAPFTRYQELGVGLATDLSSKVRKDDVGKIMLFVFAGTKPTSKDPLKLFNVVVLSTDEAREIMKGGPLDPSYEAAPDAGTTGTAIASKDIF